MYEEFIKKFAFDPSKRFCLGVEEEVWTVHPSSGVLIPGALRVFLNTNVVWPNCKPELPAQQLEVVTPVCKDLYALGHALRQNEMMLDRIAKTFNFKISRAPVPEKPFALDVFPKPRYLEIKKRFGARLRGAYVAGLHIHIGIGSPEEAIRVMNACRTVLPWFLALSARSSVYAGQRMPCKSYRFVKYREMAGEVVPPYLESWDDFALTAKNKGFLEDPRMCWWGLRISPHGTVELRICDVQADRKKTLALAALFRLFVRGALAKQKMAKHYPSEMIANDLDRASLGLFDPIPALRLFVEEAEKHSYAKEELSFLQNLLS